MFKRVRWFTVGAVAGAAGTVAAARKVRSTVERRVPPTVRDGVTRAGRAAATRVGEAVDAGRRSAAARDSELRQRYEPRRDDA
jgi:hypothetical protein